MPFADLLLNPTKSGLLSTVDLLSTSGLNSKNQELAILSLKVKKAILPGGELDTKELENIKSNYYSLTDEQQELINNCTAVALAGEQNYETGREFICKTDHINFSFDGLERIPGKLLEELEKLAKQSDIELLEKSGDGNDFLGWMDLPYQDTADIQATAKEIQSNSDAVVFIGIGGSYLGAKAVLEALLPANYNLLAKENGIPELYFAGQSLSTSYMKDLLATLKGKRVTLIPISKSGTTTEPAVAFRILKDNLKESGNELNFCAITDKSRGALKELADKSGWKSFVIADDVGGRFSVFSPVGLLPIAIAGVDVSKLLDGAKSMMDLFKSNKTLEGNPALTYAIYRQAQHLFGKETEVLSTFSPFLTQVTEWWKQLYGESEGKDGKGIFVASTTFTTDLHSVGQILQAGKRNFFETFLTVEEQLEDVTIGKDPQNLDNLNYLAGKSPDYVNSKAYEGTRGAHEFGEVPTLGVSLKKLSAESIGALLQWWEYACGVSAYMQGVNPFDQPGVEEYKSRMFKLLGKP